MTTPALPDSTLAPERTSDGAVAVSPAMRQAKQEAQASHVTIGTAVEHADGRITIGCSCGMTLTNGPGWSLDEHIRLHRAEARYVALSHAAPAGMPRLVLVGADRLPTDTP
ncbi:hypothetical protein GCM10025864_35870 [Luteimicrobium album]|uniref:C2H2-type domain-containing protein n=1 Tax=Luteimicrobium album TaxID=1054550 RepID=A0ABQ6I4Y3_9MICO|nr:hypothetical protein [Luteimicrobium album]GMA25828.1 hypothetical protein GCM10025864_35870 [Luteimicrobium album]